MKFASAFAASALAGSASAWLGGHYNYHAKRDPMPHNWEVQQNLEYPCCLTVVTVTVTSEGEEPTSTATVTATSTHVHVVTTSSSSSSIITSSSSSSEVSSTESSTITSTEAPTTTAAPAVLAETSTPAPPPPSTTPSSAPASSPAPAASVAAVPAAAPAAYSATQGSCNMVTNGNKWAMVYTQYSSGGGCQSADQVYKDIATIKAKGFTTIRMYGTDCSGLQNIGAAVRANGMKMIVGVFIGGGGIGAAQSQVGDIASWGASNWDIVSMIVVGNEAVSAGACDAGSLAAFVASAKGTFQAAGSGCIPVTTTDTVAIMLQHADVFCPVVDVIGANIETYFNGGVLAAAAGTFAAAQLAMVQALCGGTKEYYNLESGWPSGGGNNGASVASSDSQNAAVNSILSSIGARTVIFSFQNDYWKSAPVDQNFGCAQWF
jgi:exo-beta-1,3-glucanase (GH17 family)